MMWAQGKARGIPVLSYLEKPPVAGQPVWKLQLVGLVAFSIQVQRNYISSSLAQVV